MGNCLKKSFLYSGSIELLEPLVSNEEDNIYNEFVSKQDFNKLNNDINILKLQLVKLEKNTHENLQLLSEDIHFINENTPMLNTPPSNSEVNHSEVNHSEVNHSEVNHSESYIDSHIMDSYQNNIEDTIPNTYSNPNDYSSVNQTEFVYNESQFNNTTNNSHYLYNSIDN